MKASELSLFSSGEQTVLVATEPARLAKLTEDEIADLLVIVRRARTKYSTLHRRQSAATIAAAGKRSAASSSNTRTLRKAEIFEDALARVSRALAVSARASRDALKAQRLAAARGTGSSARKKSTTSKTGKARTKPTTTQSGPKATSHVTKQRMSSTRATNARHQARRDRPR